MLHTTALYSPYVWIQLEVMCVLVFQDTQGTALCAQVRLHC